jgi:phage terminase large subunit
MDTLTKVAIDKKNRKIYVHECIYENKLSTPQLIEKVKHITQNKLVIADNSSNRLIAELSNAGINILPCTKGAGSIEDGIKLMLDYEIIVTPSSTNIVKELNNYIWSNKKAGQPRDMYNHSIDGIRYIVSHLLKKGEPSFDFISFGL